MIIFCSTQVRYSRARAHVATQIAVTLEHYKRRFLVVYFLLIFLQHEVPMQWEVWDECTIFQYYEQE